MAAAPSPVAAGGGCRVGTAFEDLAGVDVGDTLFVGEPWKMDRKRLFSTGSVWKGSYGLIQKRISPLLET